MANMPARVKYRKQHRGRIRGKAARGNTVAYGDFGLQVYEGGWLTARQIEAGRMAATHFLHREGRVIIRVFPHKSVTAKPLEQRMGKGKAEVDHWVAVVKPGTVLYEIGEVDEDVARAAFSRVAHKMPFRCRFIKRRHGL
ncbi:MAG: 50S ribosomal protein L16 [Phycisphaerae bacterium]